MLGHQRVGIYGNSKTIDWALQDGLGSWFWQHNWGSPRGFVHPAAHLHQFEIDARSVAGVGVDLNNILAAIRSVGLNLLIGRYLPAIYTAEFGAASAWSGRARRRGTQITIQ